MKISKFILAGVLLIPGLVFGQGTFPTTTAVVSSLNPSMFGNPVTFTATVSASVVTKPGAITPSGAATPTGTVQFKDGAANLGAPVPLVGLSAAFTTSTLAVGNHPITAVYSGDGTYASSTSPILIQVVIGPQPSSTSLVSSLNPSLVGQAVTFTATVTGNSPTGTVQFKDGATNLGGPVAMSGATAAFTTSALTLGTHPITAVYSGNASNAPSTSPVLNQVVNAPPPGASSIVVVSSLNPSLVGQAVTFTATVTGSSPTGTVQFKDGATNLGGPVAMTGATAAFTTSALTLGTHPITAVYSGDANNATSTSVVVNQVVIAPAPGATSTSLTSSQNPSTAGQAVTFTATVTGNNPTGTVQFKDGATVLGVAATPAPSVAAPSGPKAVLAGGVATLTTSALAPGAHAITAVYSGDANNAASTSAPLTQTVVAVAAPGPDSAIPTLSQWALVLLAAVLGVIAMMSASGRKRR